MRRDHRLIPAYKTAHVFVLPQIADRTRCTVVVTRHADHLPRDVQPSSFRALQNTRAISVQLPPYMCMFVLSLSGQMTFFSSEKMA